MAILRGNSRLHLRLGEAGVTFIEHAASAIKRLLPHVEVSAWSEDVWHEPGCVWTSSKRTEVRVTLGIGKKSDPNARSLSSIVKRRRIPGVGASASEIIDLREHDMCGRIARRISQVMESEPSESDAGISLAAIQDAFDEHVVASHIQGYHELSLQVAAVLEALHKLSEQSYENKALTFGCVLEPNNSAKTEVLAFPHGFLGSKKYKALSDGFRTSYIVSTHGKVTDLADLDRYARRPLSEKNYFPDWTEPMARASRDKRCGISLSRQGDILVFDEGTLRFTYRYGKWQYWNHVHLVNLLRDRARAQRVPTKVLGRVVGAIYRAALDVSFRRSGGLFVILHNRNSLHQIVRQGDAVADAGRTKSDAAFDAVVKDRKLQALPRSVAVELASLDGAVVIENSGRIVAYGSVLQPKKAGKLRGTEGSRTKAAIGASNYGLAIKISSDGDISVYYDGKEFIRV